MTVKDTPVDPCSSSPGVLFFSAHLSLVSVNSTCRLTRGSYFISCSLLGSSRARVLLLHVEVAGARSAQQLNEHCSLAFGHLLACDCKFTTPLLPAAT